MVTFAAVDVETTGFGRLDRIIEVAVVVMECSSGDHIAEFDTLVNPLRDIGATEVHGITATMVEAAPTFNEVAGALLEYLDGNVLVAHNLPFDQRFLEREFERAGVMWEPGQGICTLDLTRESLARACRRHGIPLEQHHRALVDARAAAGLCRLFEPRGGVPVRSLSSARTTGRRLLRRDAVTRSVLPCRAERPAVPLPSSANAEVVYLDVLDRFLDDLVLTDEESDDLAVLARSLGVTGARRRELDHAYFMSFVAAARRDGVISRGEHTMLTKLATALSLPLEVIPEATSMPSPSHVTRGERVCFTGSAVVHGAPINRQELESLAARVGLQPVSAVTKRTCDLLVASDSASMSGKAEKARAYGIPIISVGEFLDRFA